MAIWFMFFEAAEASLSSRDYDVGGARGWRSHTLTWQGWAQPRIGC
jgi:hypothetical protein